jgi:phosphoglycolate phosphatase
MIHKTAVLFDLDGTLVDTLEDLADSVEATLREYGYGNADGTPVHPLSAYRQFVGNGGYKLIERAFPAVTSETLTAAYRRFLQLYGANFCNKTAPYNGVLPLLDELTKRHIPWGIVTNKPEVQAKQLVDTLFSAYPIACVYGGGVVGRPHKPDATVTKMALSDLSALPENTLYVGDSDVDVYTAHNAGMVCAGAAWGFRGAEELKKTGAEILLHHPLDLLKYL